MAENRLPMGRPPKCTEETIAAICRRVSWGTPAIVACAAEGVRDRTYHHWIAMSDEEPGSIYELFAVSIEAAHAQFVSDASRHISESSKLRAGEVDWKAMAWLAERVARRHFGREEVRKVEVTGKDGAPVASNVTHTADPRIAIVASQGPKAMAYLYRFKRFPSPEDLDAFAWREDDSGGGEENDEGAGK